MSSAPESISPSGSEAGAPRPSAELHLHPRFAAALEELRTQARDEAGLDPAPAASAASAAAGPAAVPAAEPARAAESGPAAAPVSPSAPEAPAVKLGWAQAAEWERALKEEKATEAGAAEDEGSSTLTILFGLAVVWGVLYVLAHAQSISWTDVSFSMNTPTRGAEPRGLVSVLDARQKAMLVGGIFFHDLSKREMVRLTMQRTGVRVAEEDLALLPEESRTIDIDDKPVYELLHAIIDDPGVGFGLRAKDLTLFRQKIQNTEPGVGRLRQFEWEAVVPLREEPTLVFPSPRSDVWASFSIVASSPGSAEAGRVAVEIWRGGRPIATGEGKLGAEGKAQLSFGGGGALLVTVETAPADPAKPEQESPDMPHKLRIYYEAGSAG